MAEPGTFVWNELMTPDADGAKKFYGELLGWSAADVQVQSPEGPFTYTLFKKDDRDCGGMMKMDGPMWQGVPPHWMAYVEVADVDAAAAKVTALGGKVCVPPTDIPDIGRFCVINDPAGATLSLMTTKAKR